MGENGAAGSGIYLAQSYNVVIQGNLIGTDADWHDRPRERGLRRSWTATNMAQLRSAARPPKCNVISGNLASGVALGGIFAPATIEGNYIGTNAAGTSSLGNVEGVSDDVGESAIQVGGTTPGAGNLISGNGVGIDFRSNDTVVQGNLIGSDATGTSAIGNGDGIYLGDAAANNTIGGDIADAGNVLSGKHDWYLH